MPLVDELVDLAVGGVDLALEGGLGGGGFRRGGCALRTVTVRERTHWSGPCPYATYFTAAQSSTGFHK